MNFDTWKYFKISQLFDVKLAKGDIQLEYITLGTIPLISSGNTNNGVIAFIGYDNNSEIFPKNSLTVDMFCNCFYQNLDFYAVSHGRVNVLLPKFPMNEYIGLFIATLINKEKYKFSYGRAVYSNVVSDIKIKLPSQDLYPDLEYIELYMKKIKKYKIIKNTNEF